MASSECGVDLWALSWPRAPARSLICFYSGDPATFGVIRDPWMARLADSRSLAVAFFVNEITIFNASTRGTGSSTTHLFEIVSHNYFLCASVVYCCCSLSSVAIYRRLMVELQSDSYRLLTSLQKKTRKMNFLKEKEKHSFLFLFGEGLWPIGKVSQPLDWLNFYIVIQICWSNRFIHWEKRRGPRVMLK